MKDRDVDQAVRDLVREPVDLPSDGLDRALASAKETPQRHRRRWWPLGADRADAGTTKRLDRRAPLAGLAAVFAFVVVVVVLAGLQLGDDQATLPAASLAPTPTVAPPSCLPSGGGSAGPCPLIGSGSFTDTTRSQSTVLPVRTVGSVFGGPREPFELYFENESNELEIRGIAEAGLYEADPRFFLGAGGSTLTFGVDTVEGSECILRITFVNAWSMSGDFSCDDHASADPGALVDLSGTFEVSIAERGAASAYRSDSFMEGFDESDMVSYDSTLYFDGALESIDAEFPDGPMRLLYRAADGSTMEVTGTTGEGSFTEADGFSLVVEDQESGFLDLDPGNSDCTIEVEQSDETLIAADFECRFVGRQVGGTFKAIP